MFWVAKFGGLNIWVGLSTRTKPVWTKSQGTPFKGEKEDRRSGGKGVDE
jgi:hypothetical protein